MIDYSDNRYLRLFDIQKSQQLAMGRTSYKERIKKLKALQDALENTYKQALRDALYKDFKKPQLEVDLSEIYPLVDEIKFVSKHLRWNYPINLTFGPLVSAIAAGNTVIIKPSEMTPHTSKVMCDIVNDLFEECEVALIEGEVEVSTELLKLPFNHIFFT